MCTDAIATCADRVQVIGVLACIGEGAGMPMWTVLFGEALNAFDESKRDSLTDDIRGEDTCFSLKMTVSRCLLVPDHCVLCNRVHAQIFPCNTTYRSTMCLKGIKRFAWVCVLMMHCLCGRHCAGARVHRYWRSGVCHDGKHMP